MNELQRHILDIFKAYADACKKNNLRYFAIGGTAIGSVRHHGFIPWDDDMDIAMPVEDYSRFIDIAKTILPDRYELVAPQSNSEYPYAFAKIIDNSTTVIEKGFQRNPRLYYGAWLDVFPLLGVPTRRFEQWVFVHKLKNLYRLDRYRRVSFNSVISIKAKVGWTIAYPLRFLCPQDMFIEKYMNHLNTHLFDASERVGLSFMVHSKLYSKPIFPKEWFSDYVLMPFEDTLMRVPIGYHEYLSHQHGDYMTYPPVDQRFGHSVFVDLEHSYKDYQSGKLCIPSGYFD